jgi:hypothetical protein
LLELQEILENFVVRGLNISKEKIYSKIADGGLNLYRLHDFVITLQSYWIKRILTHRHDNWRNSVLFSGEHDLFYINEKDILNFGPVLTGICESFMSFRNRFGTVGNNFIHVPILNNPYFFL